MTVFVCALECCRIMLCQVRPLCCDQWLLSSLSTAWIQRRSSNVLSYFLPCAIYSSWSTVSPQSPAPLLLVALPCSSISRSSVIFHTPRLTSGWSLCNEHLLFNQSAKCPFCSTAVSAPFISAALIEVDLWYSDTGPVPDGFLCHRDRQAGRQ